MIMQELEKKIRDLQKELAEVQADQSILIKVRPPGETPDNSILAWVFFLPWC
jgi:hypothetical protein